MAQSKYTLQQGESVLADVEISKNGQNVDLSGAANIYAEVSIQGTPETVIKYALSPSAGEKALTVDGVSNYIIKVPIEREDSKLLSIGALKIDVVVKTADASLPGGFSYDEFSDIAIGTLIKGNLKDVNLA